MNYRNVITWSLLGIGLTFAVLPTTPAALGREIGSAEKEKIVNLALGAADARFSDGVKLFIFERTPEKQIMNIKSCVILLNQFIGNKYQIVDNIMEANVALYDVDAFGRRPPNDKIFERVIDHKIKEYLTKVGYGAVLVINNIWTSISSVYGEQWWNLRSIRDSFRNEMIFQSFGFVRNEILKSEYIDTEKLDIQNLTDCAILYAISDSASEPARKNFSSLRQEAEKTLEFPNEYSGYISSLIRFVAAVTKDKQSITRGTEKILSSNIGK